MERSFFNYETPSLSGEGSGVQLPAGEYRKSARGRDDESFERNSLAFSEKKLLREYEEDLPDLTLLNFPHAKYLPGGLDKFRRDIEWVRKKESEYRDSKPSVNSQLLEALVWHGLESGDLFSLNDKETEYYLQRATKYDDFCGIDSYIEARHGENEPFYIGIDATTDTRAHRIEEKLAVTIKGLWNGKLAEVKYAQSELTDETKKLVRVPRVVVVLNPDEYEKFRRRGRSERVGIERVLKEVNFKDLPSYMEAQLAFQFSVLVNALFKYGNPKPKNEVQKKIFHHFKEFLAAEGDELDLIDLIMSERPSAEDIRRIDVLSVPIVQIARKGASLSTEKTAVKYGEALWNVLQAFQFVSGGNTAGVKNYLKNNDFSENVALPLDSSLENFEWPKLIQRGF